MNPQRDFRQPKHSDASSRFVTQRFTALDFAVENLLDGPAGGLSAWARTTAGLVLLLLALQIITGVLLAFYYVPSADAAYSTVAYVEKVLPAGSWIRALHFYGSQLLPVALLLHLAQMLWRGAFARKPVGWVASVLLLALSLGNGATGYSLPWDARAFFSTRVAENVTGGLPLVGSTLRAWLDGGAEISTLTLSRFFALHALVLPFVLLCVAFARLFVFREPEALRATADGLKETDRDLDEADDEETSKSQLPRLATRGVAQGDVAAQLARNALVAGALFLALALYASKHPAPLGPSADAAPPGYLPRPGVQFLWLFEFLKLFPKTVGSLVAFFLPALIFASLAALPFARQPSTHAHVLSRRRLGQAILVTTAMLVTVLTTVAYVSDSRDPRVREQFARQAQRESEFRAAPFTPRRTGDDASSAAGQTASSSSSTQTTAAATQAADPPEAFTRNCAKCHGAHAEGKGIYPSLVGISERPHRTAEDIVAILNNPSSYGLESRMPSFARKLSDDEKRAITEWVVSLK